MIRYENKREELEETRSIKKPKAEPGYEIKRAMVRDPDNKRRLVKGWKKVRKHKTSKKVGGMSKAQRRKAARKAVKTKRKNVRGQKIAKKRAKQTRKKSKQAGFS